MTVVHVHAGHVPGRLEGISGNVESFVRHTSGAGVPIRLMTDDVRLGDLNRLGTHVHVARRARALLRGAQADPQAQLLHYHANIAAMGLSIPDRLETRVPVLFHLWNALYVPEEAHGSPSWRARWVHRATNNPRAALRGLERADAILVSSEYQRNQLRSIGFAGPVHVIPNGVNLERFRPATPSDRAWARAEYGLPAAPLVVYYGHLSPWKGVDVLVEAVPRVQREAPGFRLLIAHTSYGPGPEAIQRRLDELGLRELVHFETTVDVPTLLQAADLVVVPTIAPVGSAIHPNVLLEAMAAGLPVVATDVGAMGEVVQDGLNGRLVPPGDPDRLADAVLQLLQEPFTSRDLGHGARRTMEERFSWPRAAKKLADLYRRLGVDAPSPAAALARPDPGVFA